MATRPRNAPTDRAEYDKAKEALTAVRTTSSENVVTRNQSTRTFWLQGARLMGAGTLTAADFWTDWQVATTGEKPDLTTKANATRVSECGTIADAAKANLDTLLDCWPPLENGGKKTTLSRKEFYSCAVRIAKNDNRPAKDIVADVRKDTTTFLGAVRDELKRLKRFEKSFPAEWPTARAWVRSIEDYLDENKAA